MNDCQTQDGETTLTDVIRQGMERIDLDAHLACMALTYTFHDLMRTPFAQGVKTIKSMDCKQFSSSSLRPHDVAVAGVRIALGWDSGRAHDSFGTLCEREMRRQPLPPFDTVATDPRLLVGVCAGSIRVDQCRAYKQQLWSLADDFRYSAGVSPWRYVLACWALRLLAEGDEYNRVSEDLSRYLARFRSELSLGDRAAMMWAVSHYGLLMPTAGATDLDELEKLYGDLRKVVGRDERLLNSAELLEAAFVYDAVKNEAVVSGYKRSVQAVIGVIDVFDRAAISLKNERRKGKHPYTIVDEYDVQDLFYAMALPALPDLEREKPTNKDAGSSKRIDFVSRQGRVGIEIKYIEKAEQAAKTADDLKIDIESYHIHPACQSLICFVYDPDRQLTDAPIIERDLSGSRSFNGRPMEVITRVRPH